MSGIKRLKSYFFTITSILRPDGTQGGTRLRDTDKPNQQTFEDLLASTTFSKESSDRAKPYITATDLSTEQGLVVLATDVQAKAGATQLLDRSLVVSPSQLPTSGAQTVGTYEDMPNDTVEVNTLAVTTRNSYGIRLSNSWIDWIISRIFKQGGVEGDVPIKASATNYDWSYGNVGDNTTTVNAIANNATFVSTLTNNATFTTALQTTINNIITSNPQYFTDNLPVGIILSDTAVGTLGSKWLLASGAAISRTTYADLFAKVGTTYGVGDGSTTFNIPNLSQRQISGYDNTVGYTLGTTGGAHTQTLIEANLPPHAHSAGSLALTIDTYAGTFGAAGPEQVYTPDTTFVPEIEVPSGVTGNGAGASTAFSIKDQYISLPFYIKVLV